MEYNIHSIGRCDSNSDGSVDKSEWVAYLANLKAERGQKVLDGFFAYMERELASKLLTWPGWEEDAEQKCPLSGAAGQRRILNNKYKLICCIYST